jgi:hypothetical protein
MLTPIQEKRIIYFKKMIDLYENKFQKKLNKYNEKLIFYYGELNYEIRHFKFPSVEENLKEIEKMCLEIREFTKQLDNEFAFLNQIKNDYQCYLKKLGLDIGTNNYGI